MWSEKPRILSREVRCNTLCEMLVKARRSKRISFDAIRDDGLAEVRHQTFADVDQFWHAVDHTADTYRLDLQTDQPYHMEVWVEATGMLKQIASVVNPYGIAAYSSGGFDSVTTKHDAGARLAGLDRPAVVLSVGDYDPSGCSKVDSAAEDMAAFADGYDPDHEPIIFDMIAITPDQIDRYDLPTAPAKPTDRRGGDFGATVQVEALTPPMIAHEVEAAIVTYRDQAAHDRTLARQRAERGLIRRQLEDMTDQARRIP